MCPISVYFGIAQNLKSLNFLIIEYSVSFIRGNNTYSREMTLTWKYFPPFSLGTTLNLKGFK